MENDKVGRFLGHKRLLIYVAAVPVAQAA